MPVKGKKRGKKKPLFDIRQAASCTECTGLLPAQIQTDEEGEAISELQNVFPVLPPDGESDS